MRGIFDVSSMMTKMGRVYRAEVVHSAICRALGRDYDKMSEPMLREMMRDERVVAEFERRGVDGRIFTVRGRQMMPRGAGSMRCYKHRYYLIEDTSHQVRLDKDGALPVYAPIVVTDSQSQTIVMLRLIGTEQSVKANWAQLMTKRSAYVGEAFVRLDGMKQHLLIKARLPMGLSDWIILSKQASLREMSVRRPFFVLDDGNDVVPAQFFGMLDKGLALPMLASWASYLWEAGRREGVITWSADVSYGLMAWRVMLDEERWAEIVQAGMEGGVIEV